MHGLGRCEQVGAGRGDEFEFGFGNWQRTPPAKRQTVKKITFTTAGCRTSRASVSGVDWILSKPRQDRGSAHRALSTAKLLQCGMKTAVQSALELGVVSKTESASKRFD